MLVGSTSSENYPDIFNKPNPDARGLNPELIAQDEVVEVISNHSGMDVLVLVPAIPAVPVMPTGCCH